MVDGRDKHPGVNWALMPRGSKMTQREKYSRVRDGGKQVADSHDPEFGQTTVKPWSKWSKTTG